MRVGDRRRHPACDSGPRAAGAAVSHGRDQPAGGGVAQRHAGRSVAPDGPRARQLREQSARSPSRRRPGRAAAQEGRRLRRAAAPLGGDHGGRVRHAAPAAHGARSQADAAGGRSAAARADGGAVARRGDPPRGDHHAPSGRSDHRLFRRRARLRRRARVCGGERATRHGGGAAARQGVRPTAPGDQRRHSDRRALRLDARLPPAPRRGADGRRAGVRPRPALWRG